MTDEQRTTSIIDQILSSQQAEAIERLSPSETVTQLLRELSTKEADVLRRRFGLADQAQETLEDIGRVYHVTRERIRQIERQTLQKVKRAKGFEASMAPVKAAITQALGAHGGFLEEQALLATVLQLAGDSTANRQAMKFLLHELLDDHVHTLPATDTRKAGWRLRHVPAATIDSYHDALQQVFRERSEPLTIDALLPALAATAFGQQHADLITEEAVSALVALSLVVAQNPFGEFGLAKWGRIHPRRMNDKIYLVLKREGKPMHFHDIAKRINEIGFDSRQAYPPTVHNELILDSNYVLVGRGMYALKEWGYEPGVVADVIAAVLEQSDRPLTRQEILEAVLQQRVVKKNTVHLALTNTERFEKHSDGSYSLKQTPTPTDTSNA